MSTYDFTDLTAPVDAAARRFLTYAHEQGRHPVQFSLEQLAPEPLSALRSEMLVYVLAIAPIVSYDTFLEVRSALQAVVWGPDAEPLTEEQQTLWDALNGALSDVQDRLTKGRAT